MINTGTFQIIVEQIMAQAPDQIDQIVVLLTNFTGGKVVLDIVERIFAVMFHIGASILVFYACKDKSKFWLYPLAVILHTAMDFIAALVLFNVISISAWGLEILVAIFGMATFFGALFFLYKKDSTSA